jgi:hypothetical protein
MPPGVCISTGMLTDPCRTASFETLFKFPSDPLGTPSPAESFWKTKFPDLSACENTIGDLFASTSDFAAAPVAAGAAGRSAGRSGECTEYFELFPGPTSADVVPIPPPP